jgi:dihydropteroate synthase
MLRAMWSTVRWKLKTRTLEWGARPLVMGILNVTPDSFSDGGKYFTTEQAVDRALELIGDGADLLDIGGESTRPGAAEISAQEELDRILPVFQALQGQVAVPLSVDTWKSEVARQALEAGAEIINDVSGGEWDPYLWSVIGASPCGYVLTHAQGRPATMQDQPVYKDVVGEVVQSLKSRLETWVAQGLEADRVVLDPGIGFGKTVGHNLALIHQSEALTGLGRPLMYGVSRKKFLKKIAGDDFVEVSTQVAQAWAAAKTNGSVIWRAHDVRTSVTQSRLVEALRMEQWND